MMPPNANLPSRYPVTKRSANLKPCQVEVSKLELKAPVATGYTTFPTDSDYSLRSPTRFATKLESAMDDDFADAIIVFRGLCRKSRY